MKLVKPVTYLLGLALVVPLLMAACGGSEPEELEFHVKVEHEKLNPESIKVKQHDMVTLKIESEEPGEFHLHGYDIERDVKPGEVVDLVFEADITGGFKITFHNLEEHEGEDKEVGFLEVRPR